MTDFPRARGSASIGALIIPLLALANARSSPAQSPRPGQDANIVEPVLGVAMGTSREALAQYLTTRGWRVVVDSMAGIGNPSIYTGMVDGRDAEVAGYFGSTLAAGRLIQLFVVFHSATVDDFRTTYAWAYHHMSKLRCPARLTGAPAAKLDSLLGGSTPFIPADELLSQNYPLLPGHLVVDFGNLNWPKPAWAATDERLGIELYASSVGHRTSWPYQVTLWVSKLVTLDGNMARCQAT